MQSPLSYRINPIILELLGPLPVSPSDEPLYLALLGAYARLCQPTDTDIVLWGFVKDLVDYRWENGWCVRLKGVIREPINRACRELSMGTQGPQQIGTKSEITTELDGGELDPDMMMRWVSRYEMVDAVHRNSDDRFQATLTRIAQYKEGLGARLRRTSDDILESRGLAGVAPSLAEYVTSLAYRGQNPDAQSPERTEITSSEKLGAPPSSADERAAKVEEELADLPKAAGVKPSVGTPPRSEKDPPPPSVTVSKAAEALPCQEPKTAPQPDVKRNG